MPDHVHLFASPSAEPVSLEHWVRFWKAQLARQAKITGLWQSDHWDRRLRSGESYQRKWEYVRANPVRKGLVKKPEDWPYQGEIHALEWW